MGESLLTTAVCAGGTLRWRVRRSTIGRERRAAERLSDIITAVKFYRANLISLAIKPRTSGLERAIVIIPTICVEKWKLVMPVVPMYSLKQIQEVHDLFTEATRKIKGLTPFIEILDLEELLPSNPDFFLDHCYFPAGGTPLITETPLRTSEGEK